MNMKNLKGKLSVLFISTLLALSSQLRADEGMWLLHLLEQLNYSEMKAMGLEITPEQVYSLNQSSLKDAVGALDYGSCTAELISGEGLLLTNHHCGYGEIQNHSSVEHNYLKNGFWAMTKQEELPNPGKTVSFVIRFEDITDKVVPLLGDKLTGMAKEQKLASITEELKNKAVEGTHYEAQVKSFFNGNKYLLVVLETYKDVRLVGTPPESIGKFGHDTDNWVWPRHTGDFCIFRVYTGPDGKPAEYSPDNIPLKPRHFLPVSIKGFEKDDFAMVLGFPGSTDRYATSWEVELLLEEEHPNRIKIRGIKQDLMMADMKADEKVNIQYASKYSRSSNYWKYSIGQSQGLKNLDVVNRKRQIESDFLKWLESDPDRKTKYGASLDLIRDGVTSNRSVARSTQYIFECVYQGMETVQLGLELRMLGQILMEEKPDQEKLNAEVERIKGKLDDFYKDYNLPTDKKISTAMVQLMMSDVPEEFKPSFIKEVHSRYKGNVSKYIENYFSKSILPQREKMEAFLIRPNIKQLLKDPGYLATVSFLETYFSLMDAGSKNEAKIESGRKLWMAGLQEMYPNRTFYPDANSSMRLTYGKVGDYKARDAVYFSHITTLKGVMEKEDPSNPEFVVSERLKELYNNKDYGRYGVNGELPVCFTTNNDITGGNSGSPVMNSRGELIGVAFDGNWEAMSGDIAFEPELQKCINVDIRYVLFVIDKYAGASHLINEMKIME